MLASGSSPADVTAELIWVGEGEPKDFEGLDVKDKILVTTGYAGTVHNIGCINKGAAGVISFSSPRPLFDLALANPPYVPRLDAPHVEPTPALKAYAEEKLARVKKSLRRPIDAHVILSVAKEGIPCSSAPS